ncbi:hypothetical protein CBL_01710 [Carabus blaptoides fortunei]
MQIQARKRATKFEEAIIRGHGRHILKECIGETEKDEMREERSKRTKERAQYYERNGYSTEKIKNRMLVGADTIQVLVNRDRDLQIQEQMSRIEDSRYNST